jgi:hypothetical protein
VGDRVEPSDASGRLTSPAAHTRGAQ